LKNLVRLISFLLVIVMISGCSRRNNDDSTGDRFEDLIKVLSGDVVRYNSCIEMNFGIDNDAKYEDCWMGKMPDRDNLGKELYWYGLVPDGSQAYDYAKLEDILNAEVFHGKSLCDVIEKVTWYSLDGCSIEERLLDYIEDNAKGPLRSAPKFIK